MTRDVLARLRAEYPAWDVTLGFGEWIATRPRLLTEAEISRGLRHVLTATTVARLRGELAGQRTIEQGIPSGQAVMAAGVRDLAATEPAS